MFAKVFAVASAALLAAALPQAPAVSQCNTGTIQCCNTVQSASAPSVANLLGLIGVAVQNVNALVGLQCTQVLAAANPTCSAQAVCCQGNHFHGLVNVGCTPISL